MAAHSMIPKRKISYVAVLYIFQFYKYQKTVFEFDVHQCHPNLQKGIELQNNQYQEKNHASNDMM